jgi:hypothetical protein
VHINYFRTLIELNISTYILNLNYMRVHKAIIIVFYILMPLVSLGQITSDYKITGTIVNGLQLKSMNLSLLDSNRTTIKTTISDSLGRFTFSGLQNGRYYISNLMYKLDSALTITNRSLSDVVISLNVCEVDASQALADIKNGKPKLLLIGGIAPVYYQGQEVFEKKFHINYYEYGCMSPETQCVIEYNKVMFKYLDQTYNKRWRKEVRKDVVGYK